MIKYFSTGALILLAACAQSPDKIAAIDPGVSYRSNSCSSTRKLLATETARLDSLSEQQRRAASNDTLGVILLGLPVSSMSGGDLSGEIGVAKGKIEAMKLRLNRC